MFNYCLMVQLCNKVVVTWGRDMQAPYGQQQGWNS